LAPFGCGDPHRTNFKSFYAGFKDIGLLYVGSVFEWCQQFGLDVLLAIDGKNHLVLNDFQENNIE
jgi:hypothetical protein